jgi:hypothetical protein
MPGLLMDSQAAEDRTAQRFWDEIIPRHRNSLTALFINSDFENAVMDRNCIRFNPFQ